MWSLWEDRARGAIRRGLPDGPFRGVPFFLKDLGLQIEGEITTNGSRFFAEAVPLQWTASNIPIGLHFSAPSAAMRG